MIAVDGYFEYNGPQRSFMFNLPLRPKTRERGPCVFDCTREWCRKFRIVADAPHSAWPRGDGPSSRWPIRIPKDQLRLRNIGESSVYFVQENSSGAIKIGVAKNVNKRVQNMAVSTPHLLAVLAVIDGDQVVEQTLHHRFARARIRGEWFRPVPELLAYIAETP